MASTAAAATPCHWEPNFGPNQMLGDDQTVLVQLGFTFVPEWREAELLVFNTCAIRENASTRVAGVLGHVQTLKRENPEKVVAIHGCLAAHEPDELQRRAPWVDILVTTNRIDGAA